MAELPQNNQNQILQEQILTDIGMLTNKILLEVGDIEVGRNNEQVKDVVRESSEKTVDEGNKDGHLVDIDKWAGSLARMLEEVPQYMCRPGHPGRISRIPENIREVDRKSYEPYFLSIGPYHHGGPRVKKMEKRKQFVLKCVLEKRPEITLKDYWREIKNVELEARSFYSDVAMESENFLQMLLLDSLYIITVFCDLPRSQEGTCQTSTETLSVDMENMNELEGNENMHAIARAIESNDETSEETIMPRWFWTMFMHDLFLLENQIPFFVLQMIYSLIYGGTESQLTCILKDRVGSMLWSYTKLDSEMVISPTEEVHHILHLCHMFFRPTLRQESTTQLLESNQMFRLGSAVQLYEAGVSFEARSDLSPHCLLDITFNRSGKLVIPSLHVDDDTVSLLRNLIALEQMKYPSLGLNISAYAVLLLHLATIPEDVKLLRRKGIIEHHLASDKEMVYVINRLSVGLAFDYVEDNYSLKPVFQELRSYSERNGPRWKAWLKHRYFYNPWTVISLLAASFLLLLTFVQTYYTVYSYYFPCLECHL